MAWNITFLQTIPLNCALRQRRFMVRSILLVQSSFTGKNLQSIPHVYLRYVSKVDGNELSRFPFVPTVPFGCGSPLTEQLSRTTRFAFGLVVNKSVAYAFEECIDFHSAESNRLKTHSLSDGFIESTKECLPWFCRSSSSGFWSFFSLFNFYLDANRS